jgi:hypothetical protein
MSKLASKKVKEQQTNMKQIAPQARRNREERALSVLASSMKHLPSKQVWKSSGTLPSFHLFDCVFLLD